MFFELCQIDGIFRDPGKSVVLGGGTLLEKSNAGYACLLSKAQTSAIICADLFDAVAIVRQRKGTTSGNKFL